MRRGNREGRVSIYKNPAERALKEGLCSLMTKEKKTNYNPFFAVFGLLYVDMTQFELFVLRCKYARIRVIKAMHAAHGFIQEYSSDRSPQNLFPRLAVQLIQASVYKD